MKTKLTKAFFILFIFCLFSCSTGQYSKNIKEIECIIKIEKSNFPDLGKYWVVAENYNFFTDEIYNIGDTLRICNN